MQLLDTPFSLVSRVTGGITSGRYVVYSIPFTRKRLLDIHVSDDSYGIVRRFHVRNYNDVWHLVGVGSMSGVCMVDGR